MKTSSGIPPAAPAVSGPANVVLKALTTSAPGSSAAISSAAEDPGSTVRESKVSALIGLLISTTVLPLRVSP